MSKMNGYTLWNQLPADTQAAIRAHPDFEGWTEEDFARNEWAPRQTTTSSDWSHQLPDEE